MADMEVSSDAGRHRPEDDEDLIDIDFDLADDSHVDTSAQQNNDDSHMTEDYRDVINDGADMPEPTEHVMGEADYEEDQVRDDDYSIDNFSDDVQRDENQDVDLVDPDADQGDEDHGEHEQVALAPFDANDDALASDADLARVIAHPVFLVYEGEKYPLLPFNTNEESQYSVLQNDSQVQSPLEELFSACKDMLQEQADNLTLVLEFTSIGLVIDECSIYKSACSLYSVLDVYIGLSENDAASSGTSEKTPLYIDLYTQPSFWQRFEQLRDGRQAGQGLAHYASQDDDFEYSGAREPGPSNDAVRSSRDPTEHDNADGQENPYNPGSDSTAVVNDPQGETQDTREEGLEETEYFDEGAGYDRDEKYYAENAEYNEGPANDNEQYEQGNDDYSATRKASTTHGGDKQPGEEYEEEEEYIIDYGDEEFGGAADMNADKDGGEQHHTQDVLHEDSISFHDAPEGHGAYENPEKADAGPDHQAPGSHDDQEEDQSALENVEDEIDFEDHPEANEADYNYDEGDPETEPQQTSNKEYNVKANHATAEAADQDELDFGLEDENVDEADSEQTVGRTNGQERYSVRESGLDDTVEDGIDSADALPKDSLEHELHPHKTNAEALADDEDDSWLTGYDETDGQHQLPTASATGHSADDAKEADDTSSIHSFSGNATSLKARPSEEGSTNTPAAGTLLHPPANELSRKRSRSDLDDILDSDSEDKVEAKKAKAA